MKKQQTTVCSGWLLTLALVLITSNGFAQDKPAEAITLDLLKQSKAIEVYIQGGKFKFKQTHENGAAPTEFLDDFAAYRVGNISSVKNPAKTLPSWDGLNYSINFKNKSYSGANENISISGNMSKDLSQIEKMVVKKDITDSKGRIKSVQWTFKNLTGGKLYKAYYTNYRTVAYRIEIPVAELPKYLCEVSYAEDRGSNNTIAFTGFASKEEISERYKGSSYLENYLKISLSATFYIDLKK